MPELITGACIAVAPGVHRVLAPNPSFMTGPGTNSYILGEKELAVLDPGPLDEDHVQALLAAAEGLGGRIRHILLTHTHKDHSPAAARLAELTGADIQGRRPFAGDPAQDFTAAISHEPMHGELLAWDKIRLRVLHTPGHVGNHACFWLEQEKLLFTGDHLINGSTVVIIPPSGSMSDYLNSLRLLLDYPIGRIAPGHGDIIEDGLGLVHHTIEHRLARERKVVEKLTEHGAAELGALVALVYDDVNPALHPLARYSLLAHLLKLQTDGRAREQAGRWRLL